MLLFGIPGGLEMIVMLIILIVWIISLVQVITGKFKKPNQKLVWILLLVFLGILGAILFLIIGRRQLLPKIISTNETLDEL